MDNDLKGSTGLELGGKEINLGSSNSRCKKEQYLFFLSFYFVNFFLLVVLWIEFSAWS